jgi:hypothetical protein
VVWQGSAGDRRPYADRGGAMFRPLGTSPRTLLSHGSPHAMGYFSSALGLRNHPCVAVRTDLRAFLRNLQYRHFQIAHPWALGPPRCDMLISESMKWPRVRALLLAGLGMAFAYAQNGTAPIVIDYPANGSVFPPDMAAPTFLWRDPAPGAVSWRIDVSFADGSAAIHVTAKGERMRIGEIDQRCVSTTNQAPHPYAAAGRRPHLDARSRRLGRDQEAVRRRRRHHRHQRLHRREGAGQPVSRGHMLLHTSADPVGAPIFYRDVPLMPSKSESGVIKPLDTNKVPLIAWRLRDVSQTQSRVLLKTCIPAPTATPSPDDGKTLGMDLDGPANDKSLYALAPVQQKMTIRNET